MNVEQIVSEARYQYTIVVRDEVLNQGHACGIAHGSRVVSIAKEWLSLGGVLTGNAARFVAKLGEREFRVTKLS